jgi:hypothetical protein
MVFYENDGLLYIAFRRYLGEESLKKEGRERRETERAEI